MFSRMRIDIQVYGWQPGFILGWWGGGQLEYESQTLIVVSIWILMNFAMDLEPLRILSEVG